jgi:predicted TIM-barrel fold metal-dependent hydrolase
MKTHDLDPDGCKLPIKLDSTSNGEFMPQPLSEIETVANRNALEGATRIAARVGQNRRSFLTSVCGAAATLLAFNRAFAAAGHRGGFYDLPELAAFEPAAASALTGEEFIFDVQNHCVDPRAAWRDLQDGQRWQFSLGLFDQKDKCSPGSVECFSANQLVKDVFLDSDTDVSVVTALWGARGGNPAPTEYLDEAREIVAATLGSRRALMHGGVMPNEPGAFDYMDIQAQHYKVAAWKLYPQWGPAGVGYDMDDEQFGIPFIEKARQTGIKTVCAHRGVPLPFLAYAHSHPGDIARVAKRYPDMTFVCYHSGFEPGRREGPYAPDSDQGMDRLIAAHQAAGFQRNQGNLYAEMGALWKYHMRDPDAAAHVMGKLLKYFGEDRICWGTDCIWFGSPQDQIQAFRTFQISAEFQERFGYPAITPQARAKIFGLNAARIYGLDVSAFRRSSKRDALARIKQNYAANPNPGFQELGPRTRREFLSLQRLTGGAPG